MTSRTVVLCDLDHVVSDAFYRDDMIGVVTWDVYHAAADKDEPLRDVVAAVNAFHAFGLTVIGLTARPAKWRILTTAWLVKHGVMIDEILMRADEDFRPSPEMKLKLALAHFGDEQAIRDNVLLVLDDRQDVIETFSGIGVTAMQVFGRSGR